MDVISSEEDTVENTKHLSAAEPFFCWNTVKNRSAMRTCVGFHSNLIRFE